MIYFNYSKTLANYEPPSGALVVKIKSKINTEEELLAEYSDKLKFPDYFGFNWDALWDCLCDLSWIECESIVLIHEDIPQLSLKEQRIYLKILNDLLQRRIWLHHEVAVVFPETCKGEVDSLKVDFVRHDNPDPIRFRERFDLIPKELMNVAIDVGESGVKDFGWRATDALKVVNFLEGSGQVIIGGSVFRGLPGQKISYEFKGWSYPFSDPIESANESRAFIEEWVRQNGEKFIFCIAF